MSDTRAAFLRAFPAVAAAIVAGAVDQTVTATALPAIAAQFGVVERVSWVVIASLIASTVAAPVFGRLGDSFGRKPMLILGFACQGLGALGAALAPSFEALLLARLAQGLGGGALLTLAMAVVGETVPARERGRYQAYLVACFISSSALGPLLGGWLTAGFGWRAVFWAGLPLTALGVAAALRLPRRAPDGGAFRLDVPGLALFTLFVVALVAALDRAQRLDAAPALAGLALAALALALLLRVERRARDPLLPPAVLGEATVWRANALSACVAASLTALITFLPLYLTLVRGVPIATVGLMLLPMSLAAGIGALASGTFVARTGRTMALPGAGLLVAALALSALAAFAGRVPLALLPWALAVAALGFGTTFPAVQTTVQVAAGAGRIGVATASVQFTRSLGAATGTALLGAALFATLALLGEDVAPRVREVAQGGRAALAALPEEARAPLAAGLAAGFRALFAGAAVLAGLGAVLAWRVPLRRI